MKSINIPSILLAINFSWANAQEVGRSRVLLCEATDVRIELYLPYSVLTDGKFVEGKIKGAVAGSYVLDLTDYGKGKTVEPVRVTLSGDKKSIVVDQFTRKLKPTQVPLSGGTVSFDNRFATNAKCRPFGND